MSDMLRRIGGMNTTRNRNRRQRWLSPDRIQQKFEELRAMLRGNGPGPVLVQAELSFPKRPVRSLGR